MSQQNTYMDWPKDKLPAFGADGTVVIEDGNQFSRVVPLEPSQTHVLATVLSRAFYDQANFRYIIPNEQSRLDLLRRHDRTKCDIYICKDTTLGSAAAEFWDVMV